MPEVKGKGKKSEGSIDSSLVLGSVAKRLKGKKRTASATKNVPSEPIIKETRQKTKKLKAPETIDLDIPNDPIIEESPNADLVIAEIRTKLAQEDFKSMDDRIVLDFPGSASVTSNFDGIRGECSRLLFPQDEISLLSVGDQGLFHCLIKESLRVSCAFSICFLVLYISFSFFSFFF